MAGQNAPRICASIARFRLAAVCFAWGQSFRNGSRAGGPIRSWLEVHPRSKFATSRSAHLLPAGHRPGRTFVERGHRPPAWPPCRGRRAARHRPAASARIHQEEARPAASAECRRWARSASALGVARCGCNIRRCYGEGAVLAPTLLNARCTWPRRSRLSHLPQRTCGNPCYLRSRAPRTLCVSPAAAAPLGIGGGQITQMGPTSTVDLLCLLSHVVRRRPVEWARSYDCSFEMTAVNYRVRHAATQQGAGADLHHPKSPTHSTQAWRQKSAGD